MFFHVGRKRTRKHNAHIASYLSFVAGMINVIGVLYIGLFTTNVTGHVGLWASEFSKANFYVGSFFLLYVLSFLAGAFLSTLLIEIIIKNKLPSRFIAPVFLECLLIIVVFVDEAYFSFGGQHFAGCVLLMAMGIQNSLVTIISDSIVRTTHLTGMFTDLGIELAQLLLFKKKDFQRRIKMKIKLRLNIIFFFFLGGTIGGFLFVMIHIKALLFVVATLLFALFFDLILLRFRIIRHRRRRRLALRLARDKSLRKR